jgi:hypothetical protein
MSEHDREALIIWRPWPVRVCWATDKKLYKNLKWQCYCKIIAKFSTVYDIGLVPLTSNTGKLIVLHVQPVSRIWIRRCNIVHTKIISSTKTEILKEFMFCTQFAKDPFHCQKSYQLLRPPADISLLLWNSVPKFTGIRIACLLLLVNLSIRTKSCLVTCSFSRSHLQSYILAAWVVWRMRVGL